MRSPIVRQSALVLAGILGLTVLGPALSLDGPTPPKNYTKIGEALGDLDGDQVAELAIVYDTGRAGDYGTERELVIYKNRASRWQVWHSSRGPVLGSEHGGMMGDPFQMISIQDNELLIEHFGGSRDKWNYQHWYRYQGGTWYLVRASIGYFAYGQFSNSYDYDLIRGQVDVQLETESYDEQTEEVTTESSDQFSFNLAPNRRILMDGFSPGETEVIIPDHNNDSFYF